MAWNRTGSSDGIVCCGIRYGNYDRFATGNKATSNDDSQYNANNARFTVNGADLVVTENLNPNKYPKDFTETKVECQGRQYKG